MTRGTRQLRLQVFIAHPDDETYPMAGTLASLAARGVAIEVVCATLGASGKHRTDPSIQGNELGQVRWSELETSCRHLGLLRPVGLDLPDGGLAKLTHGVALVVEALERFGPDVVITMADDGAYGHGDHLAVTRWLDSALWAVDGQARIRLLHVAFVRGVFVRLHRVLSRLPDSVIAPGMGPEDLGVDHGAIDLSVDIRDWRQQKLAALGAHRSQLRGGDPHSFLMPGLIDQLLSQEHFLLRRGPEIPPGGSDPMAGLVP